MSGAAAILCLRETPRALLFRFLKRNNHTRGSLRCARASALIPLFLPHLILAEGQSRRPQASGFHPIWKRKKDDR